MLIKNSDNVCPLCGNKVPLHEAGIIIDGTLYCYDCGDKIIDAYEDMRQFIR